MKTQIYASKRYKRFFNKSIQNHQMLESVNIKQTRDATLVVDQKSQQFGIFDIYGKIIKSSTQLRNKQIQRIPKYDTSIDLPYVDEDILYLGNLEDHFGHFLLEHTNRFYPLLNKKFKNMKYILANNRGFKTVPDFTWIILYAIGVKKKDVIIINNPTKFKSIYMPETSFIIPNISSKEFCDIFNKISSRASDKFKFDKIYVSREKMGPRKTFGEKQIQTIFKKNGFKVIYPETISLNDQIALMKNCKILAGIAGSALHLSLFMPTGGTVIQIKRNRLLKDNSDTQHLISQTKNLDFILVDCAIEKYKTHHWSGFPQIIGPTRYLKQFMDDNNFTYSYTDLIVDKSVWYEYINEFCKYGGSIRYQTKRILVYALPLLVPIKYYKHVFKKWLNKNL